MLPNIFDDDLRNNDDATVQLSDSSVELCKYISETAGLATTAVILVSVAFALQMADVFILWKTGMPNKTIGMCFMNMSNFEMFQPQIRCCYAYFVSFLSPLRLELGILRMHDSKTFSREWIRLDLMFL